MLNLSLLNIGLILVIAILLIIVLQLISKKKLKKDYSYHNKNDPYANYNKINNNQFENKNRELENENKKLKNEINKLNSIIQGREKELKYKPNKINESTHIDTTSTENISKDNTVSDKIKEQSFQEDEKPVKVTFNLPITKKVFLPSPFDECKFSIEDSKKERHSSSLYCIILSSSEKSGEIFILEDGDFTKALNSPAQFLEKVCSFENTFSNTASRIENVKRGQVILDGEDWLVKEKIIIKFI